MYKSESESESESEREPESDGEPREITVSGNPGRQQLRRPRDCTTNT